MKGRLGWAEALNPDEAAVALMALRQDKRWTRYAEGMAVQVVLLRTIKGTHWENVFFSKDNTATARVLADLRARLATASPNIKVVGDNYVYIGPDKALPPQPKRKVPGITQCSLCRCDCIDLGGSATVCLGCTAEGRASVDMT